ncbi:tectonin beta-propeller repeat-containing protein 1-like [Patiria miniata]|uniref:Uncharacterized protein n=1 Tax=Patiria miniata TaxID=46514 RepID=A0A913ZN25_PATMI|nr:tectonin beta-propeller repeat-containing protein 1-like [Patiria miniata]
MFSLHWSILVLCVVPVVLGNSCDWIDGPKSWRNIGGKKMAQISVGPAGVWGIKKNAYQVLYRENTYGNDQNKGDSWRPVGNGFKQVEVGGYNQVFALGKGGRLIFRQGISETNHTGDKWVLVSKTARFRYLSVSPKGHVWLISANNKVVRMGGANSCVKRFKFIAESINYKSPFVKISAGKSGVWLITKNGRVFFRGHTYGDPEDLPAKIAYRSIGRFPMKDISSGNTVYAIKANNDVVYRFGVTPQRPFGTAWKTIPGKLVQLDTMALSVWGIGIDNTPYAKATE